MISVHTAHVNKRKANGIFWFLKTDLSKNLILKIISILPIPNVLKFVKLSETISERFSYCLM